MSLNRDRMTRLENRYELYIIDVEVQHGGYSSITEHLTAAQVIVWVRDPSSAHKWWIRNGLKRLFLIHSKFNPKVHKCKVHNGILSLCS